MEGRLKVRKSREEVHTKVEAEVLTEGMERKG